MARIRSIKPDFFTSEQIAECSPNARLLFVGIWCFSDDAGIHPSSYKSLKMQIFPADDISVNQIKDMVSELLLQNLLIQYDIDGKQYWQVTGWHHQKIDKPTFKYPSPKNSTTPRRAVAEPSPPERRGEERKGEESKKEPSYEGKKKIFIDREDVTEEMLTDWIKENIRVPIDIKSEMELCRNHSFPKPRPDGLSTMKKWLLNSQKFYLERHPNVTLDDDDDHLPMREKLLRKGYKLGGI